MLQAQTFQEAGPTRGAAGMVGAEQEARRA